MPSGIECVISIATLASLILLRQLIRAQMRGCCIAVSNVLAVTPVYRELYDRRHSQGIPDGPAGAHCTSLRAGFEYRLGFKKTLKLGKTR